MSDAGVVFSPRLLLDRLATPCLALLYMHNSSSGCAKSRRCGSEEDRLLRSLITGRPYGQDEVEDEDDWDEEEDEDEDELRAKKPKKKTERSREKRTRQVSPVSEREARRCLMEAAEARVVQAGAKAFALSLSLKQLTAAMARVPIDHGGNNPRNKQVLQKRFIEVLCELGPQEYARRFVQSVELMSVLCRESQTDEACTRQLSSLRASLDEVLTLACTDLEMDDGGYATPAELKAYKLEEMQRLLSASLYRIGVVNYLMGFAVEPALLRRVCRNLGVEPPSKESKANVLVDLIMERLDQLCGGDSATTTTTPTTASGPSGRHDRTKHSKAKKAEEKASAKKGRAVEVIVVEDDDDEEESDSDDSEDDSKDSEEYAEASKRAKRKGKPRADGERGPKSSTRKKKKRDSDQDRKTKKKQRKAESDGDDGEGEDGYGSAANKSAKDRARTRKRKSRGSSEIDEASDDDSEKEPKAKQTKKVRGDPQPTASSERDDDDGGSKESPPRKSKAKAAQLDTAKIDSTSDDEGAKRQARVEPERARAIVIANARPVSPRETTKDDEDDDADSTQRLYRQLGRGASLQLASLTLETERPKATETSSSSRSGSSEEEDEIEDDDEGRPVSKDDDTIEEEAREEATSIDKDGDGAMSSTQRFFWGLKSGGGADSDATKAKEQEQEQEHQDPLLQFRDSQQPTARRLSFSAEDSEDSSDRGKGAALEAAKQSQEEDHVLNDREDEDDEDAVAAEDDQEIDSDEYEDIEWEVTPASMGV